MPNPLASVITRTKNRPRFVQDALESIALQEYPNREVMLVNDGGEDISSIIKRFEKRVRIKYLFSREPIGRCAAANWGMREAQGKYIAYLDDDDLYYPNHLSTLVDHLEKGESKVAYTDAYRALQKKVPGGYEVYDRKLVLSHDFSILRFMVESYIHLVTFMHHRECMEKAGYFDESLEVLEDLDLFFRYSQVYTFSHVPTITAEYRIRDDGTNAITAMSEEFIQTRENLHKKYFHMVIPPILLHLQNNHERIAQVELEMAEMRKALGKLLKRDSRGGTPK